VEFLFQISLVVIVTKTDLVTEEKLERTLNDLMKHLTDVCCKKEPVTIHSEDDVIGFVGNQPHEGEVPILCISSVTGEGLNLVTKLLHLLPPGLNAKEKDRLEKVRMGHNRFVSSTVLPPTYSIFFLFQELPVFQVDETIRIPQKGTILGGLLKQGIVKERTSMLLGGHLFDCFFLLKRGT
jgi:GTPase